MQYLPTAFAQLQFSWKLYNYALEGNIDLEKLDIPITFTEESMVLVLQDKIFNEKNDLIIAIENMLGVAFGAAAITLNRCREEAGVRIPSTIESEVDQFVVLAYQIRNAFAHDISEPCWEIRNPIFLRNYNFGSISVDLTDLNNKPFEYKHIGGPDALFLMKEYAEENILPKQI
ncbi:MAG: hypothetical protein ACRBDI_03590 [Alphaproteobacteria bacterium]